MIFISDQLSWVNPILLELSVMQTRHLMLMIEDQLLVQQFTFVLISYLGGPISSKLLPNLALRQNIVA